MPRKAKQTPKRRNSQSEEEEMEVELKTEKFGVANVNKRAATGKKKKEKAEIADSKRQKLNENVSEREAVKPRNRKSAETVVRVVRPSQIDEEEMEQGDTAINFFENGRRMRMVVTNCNDQSGERDNDYVDLNAEEESEDGEIDFRPSQERKNAENGSGEQDTSGERNIPTKENLKSAVAEHKKKLNELNSQMQNKIQELHQLMFEGGLTESAEMLNRCIPTMPEMPESEENCNLNAICKEKGRSKQFDDQEENGIKATKGKSIEIIYESAVPKRNSSSSEDDLVNTSDEIEICEVDQNNSVHFAGRNDRFHYNHNEDVQQPQPSTSGYRGGRDVEGYRSDRSNRDNRDNRDGRNRDETPEENAQK